MKLEPQEIDNLLDALDCWVNKGATGQLMSAVLGGMLCGKDEAAKEAWKKSEAEANAKADNEKRARAEDAALLKAKLIMLRREALSEAIQT